MITEKGIIENVTAGRKAGVRIEKSSACAACQSRDSCSEASNKDRILEVVNDLGAAKGDQVEISMPSGSFLMLTLLVYFLPVAALILGAFLGGACADALNMRYTPASIAGACLSMAVAFIVLKRFDKSRRAQKQFKPRMTRIVRRSSGCPSDNRQEESP